jgi:hypothetical protein
MGTRAKVIRVKVYSFNWVDENGVAAGWNDVQTTKGIRDARKLAKKMESPAKDFTYGVIYQDGTTGTSTGRFTGLFVDWSTFKRITIEQHFEDHRLADIRAR